MMFYPFYCMLLLLIGLMMPAHAQNLSIGGFSFGKACNGTDCPSGEYHIITPTTQTTGSATCIISFLGDPGPYLNNKGGAWLKWNGSKFVSTPAPSNAQPCPVPSVAPTLDPNHTWANAYSVPIANSVAGHTRTVEVVGCPSGCAAGSGVNPPSSVTDGTTACTLSSNSYYNGTNGVAVGTFICPGIAAGGHTLTVTWPGLTYAPYVFVQEWNGLTGADVGIGNNDSGTSASPTIATNGPAAAGDVTISIINNSGAPATAGQGKMIDKDSSGYNTILFTVPPAAGQVSLGSKQTNNRYAASIADFR